MLEAGGAGTYTQRAIPGSDLFRVRDHWLRLLRAATQVGRPISVSASNREDPGRPSDRARVGHDSVIRGRGGPSMTVQQLAVPGRYSSRGYLRTIPWNFDNSIAELEGPLLGRCHHGLRHLPVAWAN
jgi:hypothetical protein